MGTISDPRDHWKRLLEQDEHRNHFVMQLIQDLESTKTKLAEVEISVDRETTSAQNFHKLFKDTEAKLKRQQQDLDSSAFISVLIDGDCMNFVDALVQGKEMGGQEAAHKLRDCVLEHVHQTISNLGQDPKITIRVYCNFKGMSKTCVDAGILDKSDEFFRFVRGFNMGDPLCDFIDAGSGKECSDDKLREIFKHHVGQAQCKLIVFGGSADNGYARLLGPYSGNDKTRNRITLLEGPPFAGELVEIVDRFTTTSFPTIFRNVKLPTRRVSFSSTPPKSMSPKLQTYAATVRTQPAETDPQPVREVSSHQSAPTQGIPRNNKGQRVDLSIRADRLHMAAMKRKKLCNYHYLTGFCPYEDCVHGHDEPINDKQKLALRAVARLSPCSQGLSCDDEQCIYGHQCGFDNCRNKNDCKFPPAMHDVDIRVLSH